MYVYIYMYVCIYIYIYIYIYVLSFAAGCGRAAEPREGAELGITNIHNISTMVMYTT